MSDRFKFSVDNELIRAKRNTGSSAGGHPAPSALHSPILAPTSVQSGPSPSLVVTAQTLLQDISFVRGLVYTTVPVSIITLILLAAYKRDLHTSRSQSSPLFKYPMIIAIVFSFAAPFLISTYDDKLEKIITPP